MEHTPRQTSITAVETIGVKLAMIFSFALFLLTVTSVVGFYRPWSVGVMIGAVVLGVIGVGIQHVRSVRFSFAGALVACVVALFCAGIIFFFHDVSLGRDDMGYLVAAQRLIETGNLAWHDELSRPLHSVRQIAPDVFTSQFLPLYPSLLAAPMMAWGAGAVGSVNALLWGLGLGMIFFVTRRLALHHGRFAATTAVLGVMTFYTSLWFSHRVNSENVLFFLLWFGVLLVLRGIQERRPVELGLSLFPLTLALLARGEALVLLGGWGVMAAIALLRKQFRFTLHRSMLATLALAVSPLALLLVYAWRYQAVYFFDQVQAMLTALELLQQPVVWGVLILGCALGRKLLFRSSVPFDQKRLGVALVVGLLMFELVVLALALMNRLPWSVFRIQYVMETWLWYFLFPWIALFGFAAWKRRLSSAMGWLCLLVLPLGVLILQPNIALDHPWFMRRFFSGIVPFFFVAGAVSLTALFPKRISLRIAGGLLLLNLVISLPVTAFQEHRGVSQQLRAWGKDFGPGDLLLMRPGWGWQKWAIPLEVFEGVHVLPNDDVVRNEVFKTALPMLLNRFPQWETNDEDLLGIHNTLLRMRADELRRLISSYQHVYVLTDLQSRPHPYFSEDQLTFLRPMTLTIDELASASRVTATVRQTEDRIPLGELRRRIGSIPPRVKAKETQTYYLYTVENPTQLFTQVAITIEQSQQQTVMDDDGVAVQVLSAQDLVELRRWVHRVAAER